jgi:hypothetical protein
VSLALGGLGEYTATEVVTSGGTGGGRGSMVWNFVTLWKRRFSLGR